MTPEIRELLPLYALNALAADETLRLEAHLADCTECQTELRELRETCVDLAVVAEAPAPASLKSRLMGRIAEAPVRRGVVFDDHGVLLARSSELSWRDVQEGVQMKILSRDRDRGYLTSLVKIAPGAIYPRHEHKGVEEIFVLSGDLNIEGNSAGAGDYCRAEASSIHKEAFSVNGCTFLVIASQHDELLA